MTQKDTLGKTLHCSDQGHKHTGGRIEFVYDWPRLSNHIWYSCVTGMPYTTFCAMWIRSSHITSDWTQNQKSISSHALLKGRKLKSKEEHEKRYKKYDQQQLQICFWWTALDQIQAEHNLLLERRFQLKIWRCWLRWTFTLLPVFRRWEPHFMCSHTCLCFDIPRYSFQKNYSGQHGYRQKCQWGSDVGHTACCRPGRAEEGWF